MTRNVRVTVLSAVMLYSIISLVFAEMVVFGWKINLLEAIDISIAGGMSVDYLLHLVHSFNQQPGSADDKVRGALREMGVSVTSGMGTTLAACVALYLCDMLWFRLFGCFITMVVLSSFFTSMLGLMAVLACFGAHGEGHSAAAAEFELVKLEVASAKQQQQGQVSCL
jgi:predicted RND superfamily exporter protein